MKTKRTLSMIVMILLFTLLSGCAGLSRINAFISSGEFKTHAAIIDFMLFFTIFFAMSYLGFTKAFGKGFGETGKARGAIVALSFSLGLAFAFAIVSQTSFSITTMFPLAKAFFFLVVWFVLFGLFNKIGWGEKADTWYAKLVSAILALIVAYILFSIATHMICQMSDNMDDPACESDFFNAMYHLLGRWLGIDDWAGFGGGSIFSGDGDWSTGSSGSSDGSDGGGCSGWDQFWGLCGTGGSGSGSGSGSIDYPENINPTADTPKGPIEGVCRMDILFAPNSSTEISGGADLTNYLKVIDMAGHDSVTVTGYTNTDENKNLGKERVNFIVNSLKSLAKKTGYDIKIKSGASSEGSFSSFEQTQNSRVILAYESPSNPVPAPSPGTTENCDATPREEEEEEAITEDKDKDKEEEEGFFAAYGKYLAGIGGLIIFLLIYFSRKIKKKGFLKQKRDFIRKIEKIRAELFDTWKTIREKLAATSHSTDESDVAQIEANARVFLDHINDVLFQSNWPRLRQLVHRYYDKPKQILRQAKSMNVDEATAHHAYNLLTAMTKTFPKLRLMDEETFNESALVIAKKMVGNNKVFHLFRLFIKQQRELEKIVKKFKIVEKSIVKYAMKNPINGEDSELLKTSKIVVYQCENLIGVINKIIEDSKHINKSPTEIHILYQDFKAEMENLKRLLTNVSIETSYLEAYHPIIDQADSSGIISGHIYQGVGKKPKKTKEQKALDKKVAAEKKEAKAKNKKSNKLSDEEILKRLQEGSAKIREEEKREKEKIDKGKSGEEINGEIANTNINSEGEPADIGDIEINPPHDPSVIGNENINPEVDPSNVGDTVINPEDVSNGTDNAQVASTSEPDSDSVSTEELLSDDDGGPIVKGKVDNKEDAWIDAWIDEVYNETAKKQMDIRGIPQSERPKYEQEFERSKGKIYDDLKTRHDNLNESEDSSVSTEELLSSDDGGPIVKGDNGTATWINKVYADSAEEQMNIHNIPESEKPKYREKFAEYENSIYKQIAQRIAEFEKEKGTQSTNPPLNQQAPSGEAEIPSEFPEIGESEVKNREPGKFKKTLRNIWGKINKK